MEVGEGQIFLPTRKIFSFSLYYHFIFFIVFLVAQTFILMKFSILIFFSFMYDTKNTLPNPRSQIFFLNGFSSSIYKYLKAMFMYDARKGCKVFVLYVDILLSLNYVCALVEDQLPLI